MEDDGSEVRSLSFNYNNKLPVIGARIRPKPSKAIGRKYLQKESAMRPQVVP